MKVFVYWNLHKNCWSVRYCKTRKVIHHLEFLALSDCTFKVSETGRQRVLREKRKNVHAGIEGTLLDMPSPIQKTGAVIKYNPYKCATFTCGNKAVYGAKFVMFFDNKEVRAEGLLRQQ